MIQYEKEHNVSFEEIKKNRYELNESMTYQNRLNNLPDAEVKFIKQSSWVISSIYFLYLFTFSQYSFFHISINAALTFLGSFLGIAFLVFIFDILGFDSLKFFSDKQKKQFNNNYLKNHDRIPDADKDKKDYYTYITQQEVRLSLINEIDNVLLMATHYKLEDDNITKLNTLKKEYITFSLIEETNEKFITLNNKIIDTMYKINRAINRLASNTFYTQYINVGSTKPENQLKLLDTKTKYKEIL